MIRLCDKMNFEAINLRHIYSSFKIHKVKIEAADELNVADTPKLSQI